MIRSRFGRRSTADDVVAGLDLSGRVHFVTGADSGIGFETARALASRGATTVIGSLTAERGERAATHIRERHPGARVRVSAFDLGDLEQVARAAEVFPEPRLDALICNAGVYGGPYMLTASGFERTLGVCYVGHFALTLALLPLLRKSAPARVVIVSSENHRWPRRLDLDALPLSKERYTEVGAYGLAKRALVLFANELHRREAASGVTASSLHPGDLISTGIDADSWLLRVLMALNRPFARSPAQAASTSVWLATDPALAGIGGKYFARCREKRAARGTEDPALAAALWEKTLAWMLKRAESLRAP